MQSIGPDLLRTLVLGAALGGLFVLERLTPQAALRPNLRTNLGLWVADTAVTRAVCGACGIAVAAWAQARGLGVLRAFVLPGWVQAVLGIVLLDGVSYAWHRANHRVPWLWRWHRVHHADEAFQVTTALRFHPGELLQALPVRLGAIVGLGISPLGVIAFELVFGSMNLFVHANLRLPLRAERRLAWLWVTPALHRLHHSRAVVDLNSNFGTVFSVFDRALGTLHPASSALAVDTGVPDADGAEAVSLRGALLAPLRRQAG